MGVMGRSKKVSSFELYKFNPLSPHCGSIALELVHCYTWGRLRIVTVRGNTVGRNRLFFVLFFLNPFYIRLTSICRAYVDFRKDLPLNILEGNPTVINSAELLQP